MDQEDYPSDSENSDEDFNPNAVDSDDLPSEVDSDDPIEEEDGNKKKSKTKSKKPTSTKSKTKTRKAKSSSDSEDDKESTEQSDKTDCKKDDVDEEKRTQALWADFLSGTDPLERHKNIATPKAKLETTPVDEKKRPTEIVKETKTVTEIFEFAGEKVEVEKIITESSSPKPFQAKLNPLKRPSGSVLGGGRTGNLGAVLGQLGKKNKISTLEKTKLDWNSFKRSEGIDEQLQTHNKGKDGYLERQDFLQRTDVRQFNLEKSVRQSSSRSNR